MRRIAIILGVLVCGLMSVVPGRAEDKALIKKNVDEVVAAINSGKAATSFTADTYTPYVFVMQASGKLIVHPYLAGEYLQEKAAPVYTALHKASPDGVWVTYFWKGTEKETYVRTTDSHLIVGSGQ